MPTPHTRTDPGFTRRVEHTYNSNIWVVKAGMRVQGHHGLTVAPASNKTKALSFGGLGRWSGFKKTCCSCRKPEFKS